MQDIEITQEQIRSKYIVSSGLNREGKPWEGLPWSNQRIMLDLASEKAGIQGNLLHHGYRHETVLSKNLEVFISPKSEER